MNVNTWYFPALLTFFLWGSYNFMGKITVNFIDPMSALVFEVIGVLLVGVVVLYFVGSNLEFHWKGVACATFMGCLGVLGTLSFLYAVNVGKVSTVAVCVALYPLVTICLAYIILNEAISLREGVGMVFALVAMILMAG